MLFVLIVHVVQGCDDGNNDDGDGCSSTCTVETDYECLNGDESTASQCRPVCGDSKLFEDKGEKCDDGNTNDGDGCAVQWLVGGCHCCVRCSASCTVEDGYTCAGGSTTAADTCTTVTATCTARARFEVAV